MTFTVAVAVCLLASVQAFAPFSSIALRRSTLSMAGKGDQFSSATPSAPPGYKPMADGTYRKAGEHPETFVLEHENGSRSEVDTKKGGVFTWKDASGVEIMAGPGVVHKYPTMGEVLAWEFVPEERAKKMSFDRMIFKAIEGDKEYRLDVTMREDSLEYDVIIKNAGDSTFDVNTGLDVTLSDAGKAAGYKISKLSGYSQDGDSVTSGPITIPVGKFKETAFQMIISK